MEDPLNWFLYVALGAFGLAFGSFANVVIWRLPRGESLSQPPSHCPGCDAPVAWRDNIPVVSWLLLRGHCRTCGTSISPRYPIVEITSATLWVLAGVVFGVSAQTVGAVFFFYLLLIIAFIDADTMRIPNVLAVVLFIGGLAGAVAAQLLHIPIVPLVPLGPGLLGSPVVAALVGAAASAGISLAIAGVYAAVRRQRGFGMGDVKLLAGIGAFLGLYGLMALFFGSVMGAGFGVIAGRGQEGALRKRFPFGPFLAIAAVLSTVFGPMLWTWYSGLFK